MCGISGIYNYKIDSEVKDYDLSKMRDSMLHRGPDNGMNWISEDKKIGLSHRRLSIVDLSTSAAQPMKNEDGTVIVTFNGEIYNHLDLRKQLIDSNHVFSTSHSDTEVLVHGFEEWGIDGLVKKIEGAYCFCIWSSKEKKSYLVRDRVGIKPLYFSFYNGSFLFASEIKAILSFPKFKRKMDTTAMYHYLTFLTTPAPFTMFENVNKLPAGFYMTVDSDGEINYKRYWDALPKQSKVEKDTKNMTDEEKHKYFVKGIKDKLENAVKKRMMSDVPIGVFLSGGIDSSMNVALMSRYSNKPLETFTVGFTDHTHLNEIEHARLISKKFKTNHNEILIDEKDMMEYIDDLVIQQDEPLADWVCIPLYFVSKLAKDRGVTVIQVGEGADEQFAGYRAYMNYLKFENRYWRPLKKLPKFLQFLLSKIILLGNLFKTNFDFYSDIIERAYNNSEYFWTGAPVFWNNMKRKLLVKTNFKKQKRPKELNDEVLLPNSYYKLNSANIIKSFSSFFNKNFTKKDYLAQMIYNDLKLRLPELLLMRVDKITMSLSLEARVPFLDHNLVEFTMDIPKKFKVPKYNAKKIFKDVSRSIIPDEIIDRKKMGFNAPMKEWLMGDFGKKAQISVNKSTIHKLKLFNKKYINKLFKDHFNGKADNSLYLWTIFNLTKWFDYWICEKNYTVDK